MTKTDPICEQCWLLVGEAKDALWYAHRIKRTQGDPGSVGFDAGYAISWEERKNNVIGFLHTHPGMPAVPSARDHATMRQWVDCLGKPLVCLIQGKDGLGTWWYYPDREDYVFQGETIRVGDLVFGIYPETLEARESRKTNAYYTDERFCDHCDRDTPHNCRDSGHERDSTQDWQQCNVCGWYQSGLTGEYQDGSWLESRESV